MGPKVLVVLLLAAAAAAGGALALIQAREAPAPLEAASLAGNLTLDYALLGIQPDGNEILLETTRYAEAVEANRTGPYALRDEAKYVPRTFDLARLDEPASIAEFVLARLDVAALVPGARLDVVVEDAVAPDADLVRGTVARRAGPFPTAYTLPVAEYERTTGRAPAVGDQMETTATFAATVAAVADGVVSLKVDVEDGGAIVSRPLAAVFRVDVSDDGREFWMVLHPVKDTQFRLPVENRVLGLAPGNYLWDGLDEETASYLHHPKYSPIYVGADFRLRATVVDRT